MKKTMTELSAELERAHMTFMTGTKYVHAKSGEIYVIHGFFASEDNNEIMVSYAPVLGSEFIKFVRPLSEWTEIVNGKPRSQRVRERTLSLTDEEYTLVSDYIKSLRNE